MGELPHLPFGNPIIFVHASRGGVSIELRFLGNIVGIGRPHNSGYSRHCRRELI